jgi:flagellar basal body-associated protein FliL
MSLSGQLSDLSLAELIEFFCNQHKTGRLKIEYPQGPGFFYFQNGALVDAKIGILSGVEAVYYALTLDNAAFKFSAAFPPTRRTIHQPWTHVALEGLRRMDERVQPQEAFPEGDTSYLSDPDYKEGKDNAPVLVKPKTAKARAAASSMNDSMPLSMMVEETSSSSRGKAMKIGGVVVAVVLLVAAAGIPAGWYSSKKPAASTPAPAATSPTTKQNTPTQQQQQPEQSGTSLSATTPVEQTQNKKDEAAEAAKRALEKERERIEREKKKQQEAAKNAERQKTEQAKSSPKMVTVTVTYDESGRVTSASGGDPTALRIARQKRFPPGKAGVATVTIPVN